jgi:hypothetical protein
MDRENLPPGLAELVDFIAYDGVATRVDAEDPIGLVAPSLVLLGLADQLSWSHLPRSACYIRFFRRL